MMRNCYDTMNGNIHKIVFEFTYGYSPDPRPATTHKCIKTSSSCKSDLKAVLMTCIVCMIAKHYALYCYYYNIIHTLQLWSVP